MSEIAFYNTRTRRKEKFVSRSAGRVGMYTCGPTVYSPQHIGNLRSALCADFIKRFLIHEGFDVRHVGTLLVDGPQAEAQPVVVHRATTCGADRSMIRRSRMCALRRREVAVPGGMSRSSAICSILRSR